MNKKLRRIISLGTLILIIFAVGCTFLNSNDSENTLLDVFSEKFTDNNKKVSMFLASDTPTIEVISNLETFETIVLPRGINVFKVGNIIKVERVVDIPKTVIEPEADVETDVKTSDESLEISGDINTENEDVNTDNAPTPSTVDETPIETYTVEYFKIEYKNELDEIKTVYVEPNFLVETEDSIVKEKEMFVRTSAHLYSEDKDTLLNLIEKGTKLEVLGYDIFDNSTGLVKWYKVKVSGEETQGFIRGKYLVNTEENALAIFNENNIMDIHNKRGNTFGAGHANQLDFFPREKGNFEDNIMPKEVNALYISSGSIYNADKYIEVAKNTRINAFVVDIKDNSTPAYPAEAMKKYSPTNYEYAQKYFNTQEVYAEGVKKLKDAGFYVIGRITVFKDYYYVQDHPERSITDTRTNKPFLHNNTHWPSPYQRDVWKFNVELAKESVEKFGFNEIQFDYIRFPDRTQNAERDGTINFRNTYNETKSQAIQRFAMYAVDELHELNVYVAGDVFGESAHTYVTAYGQYWAAQSNVLDVISPMSYPDHFDKNNYDIQYPWLEPYRLISIWSSMAVSRQTEIPTPAIIRPWIQSHDATKYPAKKYGAAEISAQLNAYYDKGITGGYMTWWSSSSIEGYQSEKEAYMKDYRKTEN